MNKDKQAKRIDVDKIKNDFSIVDVVSRFIEIRKKGIEYIAPCPFHDDKKPSLTISPAKGFYHCFVCDAHGDQIEFVMEYENVNFNEACEIITGESKQETNSEPVKRKAKNPIIIDPYENISIITPIPDTAPKIEPGKKTPQLRNPKRDTEKKKSFTTYKPSMVFPYKNIDGDLIGYVLRNDYKEGKKATPTILWCEMPDGKTMFSHYAFKEPRSFYGIENINNDLPVLIVEGEKCRDAAHRLLSDSYICLSWHGGTNAVKKSDWNQLKGKDITIWPDNEEAGFNAVFGKKNKQGDFIKGAADYVLDAGAKSVKCLDILSDYFINKPVSWDIADAENEGMKTNDVIECINNNTKPFKRESESTNNHQEANKIKNNVIKISSEKISNAGDEKDKNSDKENINSLLVEYTDEQKYENSKQYFKFMGFEPKPGNGIKIYIYSLRHSCIYSFSNKSEFMQIMEYIAPSYFWNANFSKATQRGISLDRQKIMDFLINKATSNGIFNFDKSVRGHGAWKDNRKYIYHVGSGVFINGKYQDINNFESKYAYLKSSSVLSEGAKEISINQLKELPRLVRYFSWKNELSNNFLVGWIISAMVCGVLDWRSHIWVSGLAGSGKSTLFKYIVDPMLKDLSYSCVGATTEAAIRQATAKNNIPVIIDEFEMKTEKDKQIMQGTLMLARASSEAGNIGKGTQDGTGSNFDIRSSFCFGSVHVNLTDTADTGRYAVLELSADHDKTIDFDSLKDEIKEIITPDFSKSVLLTVIKNMPDLLQNISVFKKASKKIFPANRNADQLGTLLGASYFCYSKNVISFQAASDWLSDKDFSDYIQEVSEKDQNQLLSVILQAVIHYQDNNDFTRQSSIAELINRVANPKKCKDGENSEFSIADKALLNIGIAVQVDSILISNTSQRIKAILNGTRWENNWSQQLKELEGATSYEKVKRFSFGVVTRATKIPLSTIS